MRNAEREIAFSCREMRNAEREIAFPVGKCEMPRGKSLFPVGKCEMPRRKSLFLSGNAKCREGNRFSRREMRNPDREIAFPDRGRATLASASQQTISARDRARPHRFFSLGRTAQMRNPLFPIGEAKPE